MPEYIKIENERVCVIPDVHQNIDWLNAVIKKETNDLTRFVQLGDMYDTHLKEGVAGARATAIKHKEMLRHGGFVCLLGNHDLHYFEDWVYAKDHKKNHNPVHRCGGHTRNRSEEINKEMTWADWRSIEPFAYVNGWVLSHAGFSRNLWADNLTIEENLTNSYIEYSKAIENFRIGKSHPLFFNSPVRGGYHLFSGIIWQDFHDEFLDDLPIKQIVGHTPCAEHHGVQQLGKCFDIDGKQSSYAIIEADGNVIFKSLTEPDEKGCRKEHPVTVYNIDDWVDSRTYTTNPNLLSWRKP